MTEHLNPDFASVAEVYARKAMNENTNSVDGSGATRKTALALTSIAASLVVARPTETDQSLVAARAIAAQAAKDQPDHYIRWLIAYLNGRQFPDITPEEPEPGRDWSRVEAHVFTATGKWKYQVFLDYTELRHRKVSGEGPHGWHWSGDEMAVEALRQATERDTSEVSFAELPPDYHMFVQNPPQGYPIWVHGRDWEFEPKVGWHPPTYVGGNCGGESGE